MKLSALIGVVPGKVEIIGNVEGVDIAALCNVLAALMEGDWAYPVYIRVDGPGANRLDPNVPLTMSITVERTAPISLILG